MEIKTKVISMEIIKPSSPTPNSLQKHRLSFLDQLTPAEFMPLVYFYASKTKNPISQDSTHLKKSLSEALTRFYPLAGRLVGNLYVDCNDGGAPFFEAEANCDLNQAITNPNPTNMLKFLPYKLNETQDFCMAVQATYFRFGGAAVGILISHKIADAVSFFSFANTWSAIARNRVDGDSGGGETPQPKFDAADYFPPLNIPDCKTGSEIMKEEISTKIFTFSAEKINVLRESSSGGGSGCMLQRRPTRVEALSAFIWTRFISATGMKADQNKVYTVQHTVNLRTRTDPPLPEYHFGNMSQLAITEPELGDGVVELVQKVRKAVKGVDGAYGAELKDGEEHLNLKREKMARSSKGELVSFTFTSLCRFPVYEADFGWGKPVWAGSAGLLYKNLVAFMDTRNGDGIEAWINLGREDMEKFEADLEMQEFLSHD